MAKRKIKQRDSRACPEYIRAFLTAGKEPAKNKDGTASEELWDIFFIQCERGNAKLKKAWDIHKDEILKDWIAEKPFTRPWPWWKCDAPEMRKRIKPASIEEVWPGSVSFELGIPTDINRTDPIKKSDFETELAYLKRLDLLTGPEKKQLKAKK